MSSPHAFIEDLLGKADIRIGGSRPQDIVVHDERLYARALRYGTLGLGEAYVDGWWDAHALDTFVAQAFNAQVDKAFVINLASVAAIARAWLLNLQAGSRAFDVGEVHYDLGNDLYEAMLDPYMMYSCGYWKDATTLAGAQEAKLELICRKIGLKGGDRVLDVGCGWGGFAKYAAERYGASVVGVTVSKEQVHFAQKMCEGLPVEIRLQDYREVEGKFDHIVSIAMLEHVGVKNYRSFFEHMHHLLNDEGILLVHTSGINVSRMTSDPWMNEYIFPGGGIPSIAQIGKALEGVFVMEDWHNLSTNYDKTLLAWFQNFDAAWPKLKEKYGERFYRMWKYYLLTCAGSFRARETQLWQIVLSKRGVEGGYTSVR